MSELKPFRLLPYGTKFRYQGTPDVWVRTEHNVIAEWPCRIWSADGTPRSSLCSFCHLDGDEDGNTLDTLVEVVDPEAELAALREELAVQRDTKEQWEKVAAYWALKAKAAEQRNVELIELLREALPALDLAAGTFKSAKPVRNKVRAALKPTESGGHGGISTSNTTRGRKASRQDR